MQRKTQYIINLNSFLFLSVTQKIKDFREKKQKKTKKSYIVLDRLVWVLNHDSLNHNIDDYLKKKIFFFSITLKSRKKKFIYLIIRIKRNYARNNKKIKWNYESS